MKATFIILSLLCCGTLCSYVSTEKASANLSLSSDLPLRDNGSMLFDRNQDSTKSKKAKPATHQKKSPEHVSRLKENSVAGEAGAGSGVGDGGSTSEADTMTILK